MKLSEILRTVGTMMLMFICAVIGFAAWMGIGLFVYCMFM